MIAAGQVLAILGILLVLTAVTGWAVVARRPHHTPTAPSDDLMALADAVHEPTTTPGGDR